MAHDRSGTTALEYAVIASLISIAIVTSTHTIGTQVVALFTQVTDHLK